MLEQKKKAIQIVVDTAIQAFAEGLISRYTDEVDDINGVINMKKNNCFIAELGTEFMFYSAFVRRFGNVFEIIRNNITQLLYDGNNGLNLDLSSLNEQQYWNAVCNDEEGFDVIFEQYKTTMFSIKYRLNSLSKAL